MVGRSRASSTLRPSTATAPTAAPCPRSGNRRSARARGGGARGGRASAGGRREGVVEGDARRPRTRAPRPGARAGRGTPRAGPGAVRRRSRGVALGECLADQVEVEHLQVAQAAVDELLERVDVPLAQSCASTMPTRRPRVTASRAMPAPVTPPPITRTSSPSSSLIVRQGLGAGRGRHDGRQHGWLLGSAYDSIIDRGCAHVPERCTNVQERRWGMVERVRSLSSAHRPAVGCRRTAGVAQEPLIEPAGRPEPGPPAISWSRRSN